MNQDLIPDFFIQRGKQMKLLKIHRHTVSRLLAKFVVLLIMMCMLPGAFVLAAEVAEQKSFSSPQQAVEALVTAVEDNNNEMLYAIFGPDSEDLISSGDDVADKNGRKRFLQAYKDKNRLEQEDNGRFVLFVGSNDYPLPIPIVRREEAWFFDTPSGKEEILNRRIGRNELNTIEVLEAYTAAQREYACIKRDGGSEFAQKLTSTEDKRDGLYWEDGAAEVESPFGPLIAQAAEQGYTGGLDQDPPEPYHGYYFKILKKQGEHGTGGAFDYVVDGKMVLGFGLVAYPAKYGASGIMTFIVNQEGIVYEKDFGEDTAQAAALSVFDPDNTWNRYAAESSGQ